MGRGCLIAEYCINGEPFYVVTSHFESLNQPEDVANRRSQLEDVMGILLKNEPNVVVAGDFNLDNDSEDQQNIV